MCIVRSLILKSESQTEYLKIKLRTWELLLFLSGKRRSCWVVPANLSDLHVGHVMHDLCKINSYYEQRPSSSCITLYRTTHVLTGLAVMCLICV